jgi:aromatic ring-opening dioxygenase LigB subunit
VLVAAGQSVLHDTANIDLTGLGYPQISGTLDPCPPAIAVLSRVTQYPRVRRSRLPLDLGILGLLVGRSTPVVALEVPATAEFAVLSALGASVVHALAEAELSGRMVVAGDLSSGLEDRSPLGLLSGAVAWDARVVGLFTNDASARLAELGPGPASAIGARGWAALCVLHGAVASTPLQLHVRRYAAPRGVGYLVMSTR